ncbi:MAG: Ig-like domain-containing protein, partial [Bacteroidia bacterium]
DGDPTLVTILSGPLDGSLAMNSDGTYTYIPNTDFVGTDQFTYILCEDGPNALCDTTTCTIHVIDDDNGTNRGPVANDDVASTKSGTSVSGSLITNDFDPDGDDIVITTTPVSGPSNGSITINSDGTYSYTPDSAFTGTDTVYYELCENVAAPAVPLCDTAKLVIMVSDDDNGPQNDPPFAGDDAFGMRMDSTLMGTLAPNDSDPNGDALVWDTVAVDGPSNGTVKINPDGTFTYTPNPGHYGTDQFVYTLCDSGVPSLCTQATAYITIFPPDLFCINLNIAALLEGPLISGADSMTTKLNEQGFLPGQTPSGLFPTPTPAGQPYNTSPWNYLGAEGNNFGDGAGMTPYPSTVTDWVLVSVREGSPQPASEVFKQAALLHRDGSIEFVGPCFEVTDPTASFYVLVEHRNHVGVMTPAAMAPTMNTNNELEINFDFRIQNSFVDLFTVGQKQPSTGVWVMFGGDPEKTGNENYEVNGNDNTIWLNDNGRAEIYLIADLNLDAEINGSDNSIWLVNNGIASGVPK